MKIDRGMGMFYLLSVVVVGAVLRVVFRENGKVLKYFYRDEIDTKSQLRSIEKDNRRIRAAAEEKSADVYREAVDLYWSHDEKYSNSKILREVIEKCNFAYNFAAHIIVQKDCIQICYQDNDTVTEELRFRDFGERNADEPQERCAYVYAWLDMAEEEFYKNHDGERYMTDVRKMDFSFQAAQTKKPYRPHRGMKNTQDIVVLSEDYSASASEGIIKFKIREAEQAEVGF
jgi:hypothetical protein